MQLSPETEFELVCVCEREIERSRVARFGKFSTLWQNFKSFGPFSSGLM